MSAEANISSIFWTASLNALEKPSFGRKPFSDLWPKGKELRRIVRTCMELDGKFLRKLAMYVARTRIWNVLGALIDRGAIRVSVRCSSGRSLLHLACVLDSFDGVRLLLAKGADVFATDDTGELPIWYAKDVEIIRLLTSVMKQQQQQQQPERPTRPQTKSLPNDVEERKKQEIEEEIEIESLFFLIKSCDKRFPFEDMAMKIKDTIPSVLTAADEASGDTIIHAAVRAGVVAVPLIVLLAEHYNVNCNQFNLKGESPLMIAVKQGSLEVADLLIICFCADVNLAGADGLAPIHVACMSDNPDAILLLLRRGAHLSNSEGRFADDVVGIGSASQTVIRQAKYDRMELLLNLAADTSITPSLSKKSELNGVTLSVGDFDLCDDDGNTILMLPSALLNTRFLSCALHVITTNLPDIKKRSRLLDARQPSTGKTALSIASRLCNVDVIRSLMSAGASPAIPDKENLLPVHHALMSGDLAVVAVLFDDNSGLIGFDCSFQLVANRQEAIAVIREAFLRRQERIVQPLLIEAAVRGTLEGLAERLEPTDIINISTSSQESTDSVTQSPIFVAVENGAVDVVKFFVERGVNVAREQPITGDTLLHVAVRTGKMAMVEFLLDMDVRRDFLEHLNRAGQSALHVAVLKGSKAIIDKLLSAGASPLLDEAAGFPPITSSYQSIQLCLDKAQRDRSSIVFDLLKTSVPTSPTSLPKQLGESANRLSKTGRYISAASSLFVSLSARPSPRTETSTNLSTSLTLQRPSSPIVSSEDVPADLSCFIQLFDFYSIDSNREHLLTAAVRQKSIPLVEQLLLIYRQLADDFSHAVLKRVVTFSVDTSSKEQELARQPFTLSLSVAPKRTELIHPCLLKSPRNGSTALHVAIQLSDSRELISLLTNACETALCVTDNKGFNPLQLAVMLSRRHAVSVLVKCAAADLNCRTPDGRTLDQLATNRQLRSRLRFDARRQDSNTFQDSDEDESECDSDGSTCTSDTSSSDSSAESTPPIARQAPRRAAVEDDESSSSMTVDEDIQTSSLSNGMSRKVLNQLYKSLDFVSVLKRYNEIQKTFAADAAPLSETVLEKK